MSALPVPVESRDAVHVSTEERAQLIRTFTGKSGLWGWLTTTDHARLAKRYIITAFCFFLLGGTPVRNRVLNCSRS